MTLKIGQEVNIKCPNCEDEYGRPLHLVVQKNSRTGRLFLGCPNYYTDEGCQHTQSIPTDILMQAQGQPTLFNLDEIDHD